MKILVLPDIHGRTFWRSAVERADSCDRVVFLGDYLDPYGFEGIAVSDAVENFREIIGFAKQHPGKVVMLLGNHDMDCITKEDFLQHTRNPGKARGRSYYSFTVRGIQFIVLDANFNEDRSPYSRGNFDWKKAYLPNEEIEWLRGELQRSRRPAIVCCHQLLDSFSDVRPEVCVGNAEEAVRLLEESGRVLAVLQGHHHTGYYSQRRGIHYWTMKGMIENEYPAHNSYAIVTVEPGGDITIEGYADCESRKLESDNS